LEVRGHPVGSSGRLSCIDREAKSQTITHDSGNECQNIMEGLACSKMKEETACRVRARDVGALATLGSWPTLTKRRLFIVCILWCVMIWKER
jgi:hypothetical protein